MSEKLPNTEHSVSNQELVRKLPESEDLFTQSSDEDIMSEFIERNPKSGPFEGKIIEKDGKKWRFELVETGIKVYDKQTGVTKTVYHSLRTWFAHHSPNIDSGPGWESRFELSKLSDEEMYERYGHKLTLDQIISPHGIYNRETKMFEGGMPNDIPYFKLFLVE